MARANRPSYWRELSPRVGMLAAAIGARQRPVRSKGPPKRHLWTIEKSSRFATHRVDLGASPPMLLSSAPIQGRAFLSLLSLLSLYVRLISPRSQDSFLLVRRLSPPCWR
jgi:hypothetical protein